MQVDKHMQTGTFQGKGTIIRVFRYGNDHIL